MLNISIVLYHPDWKQVNELTRSLLAYPHVHRIYWIDNSPNPQCPIASSPHRPIASSPHSPIASSPHRPIASSPHRLITYLPNPKNIGYGAAHNIAIRESIYDNIPFHLVINPDIIIAPDTLEILMNFIQQHPQVGCVSPKVIYPNGELQYLCKLLPTPLDVFGRRFLPKAWMKKRNERYELRQSGYNQPMNIPYLSGCFMLLRTSALQKVKLFDERFFMYPEDVDLTRRLHQQYLTIFYPQTTIVHNHAKQSYHSIRMLWIHATNMCKYFNKWGWFFDKERSEWNKKLLQELGYKVTPSDIATDFLKAIKLKKFVNYL